MIWRKTMSEEFEYAKLKPVYNVPDVAATIFSVMIEQNMNSLWYTPPEERKAMIHECFLWAEDFCNEYKKWEEDDE